MIGSGLVSHCRAMDGTLIIDKPEGITSHDVVSRVRRIIGTRRVGHAGTLDPFATGVLVVCAGRATRLVQFLVGLDKQYLGTVRLGFATDTQDVTGKQITPLQTSNRLSLDCVQSVLTNFMGKQLQMPPMFSAKKVAGERLHHAAREGREVERKPVEIVIDAIELVASSKGLLVDNEDGTRDFTINVRCSSGTYVRTLAHDIGNKLGVGAHLAALRRTAVGRFSIENALTLDELERAVSAGELQRVIVSPADTLAHLPLVSLEVRRAERISHGLEAQLSEDELSAIDNKAEWVRLCDESGALIGVGLYDRASKSIRPRVVLKDAG